MRNVALIPARAGSKTVAKKNIKLLNGIPLIAYTIKTALKNPRINKVIVSTDDEEIAGIAKKYGAEVPFLRPVELAQDNTPDRPVILHTLNWIEENEKFKPDLLIYLRPTSPFKTNPIIDECLNMIESEKELTSLRTVNIAEGTDHPYWMFKNENNLLKPFIDNIRISKYYQRQLLPSCYKLNGVVDILKPNIVNNNEYIFGNNIGFVEIDRLNAIDIDDELDFSFAEFLIIHNKINN